MERLFQLINSSSIVFADAEYLNGALTTNERPKEHHWKEVTQIGAVRCKDGKIIDRFNLHVFPRIKAASDDMSDAAWNEYNRITHITKQDVMSNTMQFEEAWVKFLEFVNNDPIVIMLGDREVYKWNWRLLNNNKDKIDAMNWTILKPLLNENHRKFCSGELATAIGIDVVPHLPTGLTTHDALYDATSMALYCLHQLQKY